MSMRGPLQQQDPYLSVKQLQKLWGLLGYCTCRANDHLILLGHDADGILQALPGPDLGLNANAGMGHLGIGHLNKSSGAAHHRSQTSLLWA